MAVSLNVIAEGPPENEQSKKYMNPTHATVGNDKLELNSQFDMVVFDWLLSESTNVNEPLNWILLTFIWVLIGVEFVPILRFVFIRVEYEETGH